jgi:ribulose-5-phosphate 4-epimerase/fuculose-1-phosphate aldolase
VATWAAGDPSTIFQLCALERRLGMSDLNVLQRDLVTANHILAREGVTDALGHVSVRHPDRPDHFFLSCSRSPELVQLDDIMEYDLECNPTDQRGRPMYFERPIPRRDLPRAARCHVYCPQPCL